MVNDKLTTTIYQCTIRSLEEKDRFIYSLILAFLVSTIVVQSFYMFSTSSKLTITLTKHVLNMLEIVFFSTIHLFELCYYICNLMNSVNRQPIQQSQIVGTVLFLWILFKNRTKNWPEWTFMKRRSKKMWRNTYSCLCNSLWFSYLYKTVYIKMSLLSNNCLEEKLFLLIVSHNFYMGDTFLMIISVFKDVLKTEICIHTSIYFSGSVNISSIALKNCTDRLLKRRLLREDLIVQSRDLQFKNWEENEEFNISVEM